MSQGNLEMARRSYEAWHRGDVGAAFEDFAPDFKLDMSRSIGMDRGIYSLDQARGFSEEFP
jgi:ketosteroid isomerase-like protein